MSRWSGRRWVAEGLFWVMIGMGIGLLINGHEWGWW